MPHKDETAILFKALEAVIEATCLYLPPDGITKDECINRVLQATDNSEINRVMKALAPKNG